MKKYILSLLVVMTVFVSCKKGSRPISPAQTIEPSIVSCHAYSGWDGGADRPRFDVQIISDSSVTDRLELYADYSTIRWIVRHPVSGRYIMYDHIAEFPTYEQSAFYHFQFVEKDGTVVRLADFQVY